MIRLTKAETALMGLLNEGESHPYLLEKNVEYRSMRDWTELSMSSIYKLLRKFEKEKLVTCRTEMTQDNKTRKTYKVSPSGKQALKRQLKELLTEPEKMKWQMDIATYNLNVLPKKEVESALKIYKKSLKNQIEGYKALDAFLEKEGCPHYRRHVAKRPIYLIKGELQWIDMFLKDL